MAERNIENLHHFRCVFCKKWWTIGDAPESRELFYCPWCGKENEFQNVAKR